MRRFQQRMGQQNGKIIAFDTLGYDAGADRFTDMVQPGILDPVRVTHTALQSALSVSASMLTTEACITGDDQSTEA